MTVRTPGLDWFSKNLIEILPAAVYVCDANAVIVAYNKRATELWGRTPALGQTDEKFCGSHKLFRPDGTFLPHHETPMAHVLRTGEAANDQEAIILRPDGTRINVLVNIAPIFSKSGTQIGAVNCFLDLTAQKAAEMDRAQLREDLQQARKMEAVGQLTGGIAHDFNNLLAAIMGNLEVLQRRIEQGRIIDLAQYVTVGQKSVKRAAALTQRLLAFSRRQAPELKLTDLNVLATGMQELIVSTVGPKIGGNIIQIPNLWAALVDRNQLENALLNLCINARDAMPDGGQLTIESTNKVFDGLEVLNGDMLSGQFVCISVRDTGFGMPPAVIERIFEPFYTTKPLGMGTGLGLSMVYGFVTQSGGQARVFSEAGKGTTISLYFPREVGVVKGEEAEAALLGEANVKTAATVLVVDDEAPMRKLVAEILQDQGQITFEAEDAAAALLILRSDVYIDLLVTDVGLPGGMSGRQLAEVARKTRAKLKILFVTGDAQHALLRPDNLESGMSILVKPFSLAMFDNRIQQLLAGN